MALTPLAVGPPVPVQVSDVSASVDLPRGVHPIAVERRRAVSRITARSGVSNCHALGDASVVEAEVDGDVVTLRADGDAACVAYEVEGVTPGVAYEVALPFRTASTSPARWCLWLDGPDRCANDEHALGVSPTWTTPRQQVILPAGVERARLFVYADGPGAAGELAVTQYRTPTVRAASPLTFDVRPAVGAEAMPGGSQTDGGRTATLHGDGHPVVVALRDTADDAWVLEGLPPDATATPVVVDGYRHGWLVEGVVGEVSLRARYGLDRWGALARWASLATAAGLVAGLLVRRRRAHV